MNSMTAAFDAAFAAFARESKRNPVASQLRAGTNQGKVIPDKRAKLREKAARHDES